ncbi:IS4 family transposase [Psychromonas sp. SR45-3]|uniref:IS4 family transposase n=1 Tax=Psychromonas sp. SR45-3 TaxID=2760930 RepID=UPI0015FC553D|nr:IS4 family transposase [Psychromonas sp. SR45-3]MBB1274817.1 IS4 family transposase [Psychromonas sp. SR45-3]
MFNQEMELVYESFENKEAYDSVLTAIDSKWIEEALFCTQKASVRRRRLPAEQAVWLIIMMGLMRNCSIKEVCGSLDIALQTNPDEVYDHVAPSVLTDCRKRLGESPMSYLFSTTCAAWHKSIIAKKHSIGLNLLAVDGTTFRAQDTPENSEAFGFISKSNPVYPQLRMVSLHSTHTRMLLGAAFDSCSVGEITLAKRLLTDIPEDSLTLFDRCYFSADLMLNWQQFGINAHWLTPVKKAMRYEVIDRYADNDLLIEMPVSPQARAKNPTLPETWQVRMICYQDPKGDIKGFITSLIDPTLYSIDALLSVYWERWEIEQSFGELKNNQLNGEITLRSRFPEGVQQELWGVLLGYNLIRLEMVNIALEAKVEPTRISFTAAICIIDTQIRAYALSGNGTIPKKLQLMREDVKHFILPKKRKHRTFSRSVLYIPSRYPLRYKPKIS